MRVTLTEEFKMLPEFYVDDVVQLLVFVSKLAERQPRVIMDEDLDGFMSFLVIFMGCPQHINNPYLRAHNTTDRVANAHYECQLFCKWISQAKVQRNPIPNSRMVTTLGTTINTCLHVHAHIHLGGCE